MTSSKNCPILQDSHRNCLHQVLVSHHNHLHPCLPIESNLEGMRLPREFLCQGCKSKVLCNHHHRYLRQVLLHLSIRLPKQESQSQYLDNHPSDRLHHLGPYPSERDYNRYHRLSTRDQSLDTNRMGRKSHHRQNLLLFDCLNNQWNPHLLLLECLGTCLLH